LEECVGRNTGHSQLENLGCVTRLNAVALRLPGVACDNAEVCACDGEDGATVLGVGIELALLGVLVRGGMSVKSHGD
jgi:hypothetical protein